MTSDNCVDMSAWTTRRLIVNSDTFICLTHSTLATVSIPLTLHYYTNQPGKVLNLADTMNTQLEPLDQGDQMK